MTREQRDFALACLDAYAEIFGPRLAYGKAWDPVEDCGCAAAALALTIPAPDSGADVAYGTIRWAIGTHATVANDRFPGEPVVARFVRVREWFASHPVTD